MELSGEFAQYSTGEKFADTIEECEQKGYLFETAGDHDASVAASGSPGYIVWAVN